MQMDSFTQVFEMVCDYCKQEITDVAYNLWIACIDPIALAGDHVTLSVRSEFQKDIIENKYTPLLSRAFESVLGFPVTIQIDAREAADAEPEPESPSGGDYEYTFDTFIVGSSNKFAHAASLAVAQNPSGSYNPLFIYGPSGLGKTHLLMAIGHEIHKNNPTYNIVYTRGEEFTNELIDAIQNTATLAFHQKYRSADVLLIDDIQFIGGKTSTQEEFFHTFNTLYQDGRQIVMTSDRPPKDIKTLEERLRTRFEWGLLADIQPPEFETRVVILRRKAELLHFVIPDDVIEYIATKIKNNIRQLEGVIKKLQVYHTLGTPPSIGIAQVAIKDILSDNQPVPVTIERIISEVARTYSVTPEEIRSNKRSQNISSARQAAMYIVREITGLSTAAIGQEFGGRDHSTVVYAIKQIEREMKNDGSLRETLEDIIKNIRDN